MKIKNFFVFGFIVSLFNVSHGYAKPISYPDFDVSMLRHSNKMKVTYEEMDSEIIGVFRKLYEQNIATEQAEIDVRIPKIIHQIWLGGEVPKKYQDWMEKWASLGGWEYWLWTDKEVETFSMHNRELFDRSMNYGEKSDILRLELLNKYGGVYVDVDYECVSPDVFEELHRQYDFYIGFEPLEHGVIDKQRMFKLCNAVIAAVPEHPLIKHLITNMKANYLAYSPFFGAVQTSGPSYITRVACEYVAYSPDRYRNMYLPCTFFYPLTEKELLSGKKRVWPETAGIHYWSGSWRSKPYEFYEE